MSLTGFSGVGRMVAAQVSVAIMLLNYWMLGSKVFCGL